MYNNHTRNILILAVLNAVAVLAIGQGPSFVSSLSIEWCDDMICAIDLQKEVADLEISVAESTGNNEVTLSMPIAEGYVVSAKAKPLIALGIDVEALSFFNKENISVSYRQDRREHYADIKIVPFGVHEKALYLVEEIDLNIILRQPYTVAYKAPPSTTRSILADGEVYKVTVEESGMYKITADDLRSLGLDPSSFDVRNLHLYGNGGGRIPQAISEPRFDDLVENAIYVDGEDDGTLSGDDAIYFYGEGASVWQPTDNGFEWDQNPYAVNNAYYIKVTDDRGLRISTVPEVAEPAIPQSTFLRQQRLENDQYNLLGDFELTQGTGQHWYGDYFNSIRSRSYGDGFDLSDIDLLQPVNLSAELAVRSKSSSRVELTVDGSTTSRPVSSVNTSSTSRYANIAAFDLSLQLQTAALDIEVNFPTNGTVSEAWLDYIQLDSRHDVAALWSPDKIHNAFSDLIDGELYQYVGQIPSGREIWEVTNPTNPFRYENAVTFVGDRLRHFISWSPSMTLPSPDLVGLMETQNLHGLENVEMVVVYHRDFEQAAIRWADHRRAESGMVIELVDIDEIVEEFGSGKNDPTAIRDFCKMLYERSPDFYYLLLFGDASYDYRYLDKTLEDQNFVPTYQTSGSLHPINDFPTDDYYALLSDSEGADLRGALDIAVGRFPFKTLQEAQEVIDKVIEYDGPQFGDWKVRQTWVADDEDSSSHFIQSERVAALAEQLYPKFNSSKIYLDAFEQQSTPGGERYPDATAALNQNFFRGHLMVNYLGHGGPRGWAQERVLQLNDVQQWDNKGQYPLMITATCTFTGFDDPAVVSGGEACILRKDGGVIGLYTTTRAVFQNSNERLVTSVMNRLYNKTEDGQGLRFGDVLVAGKNSTAADTSQANARKFVLMGDPSQRLSIPQYDVQVNSINGVTADEGFPTLQALDEVTVTGSVVDLQGNVMQSFDGIVFPTIFDKSVNIRLLNNDPGSSPGDYDVFSNIIFKGQATVSSGRFSFTFRVPSDINYEIGQGRISLYAHNDIIDAAGYSNDISIGGSGAVVSDDEGPDIQLYMDNTAFRSGGITGSDPVLIAELADDLGINVTGNSIGHDLTATLDGPVEGVFVLNDFYASATDDYRSGTVRFPLTDLEPGDYEITVKAWDTSNNSNEGSISFTVLPIDEPAVHVVAAPNPMSTFSTILAEHNLKGYSGTVDVQIYDIAGRLHFSEKVVGPFDGSSIAIDFVPENRLSPGTYVCRVVFIVDELDGKKIRSSGKILAL